MANAHQLDTLSQIASLLETGKYSDFTIRCDGREFKVHKNIVCVQSPVFAAHFQHPMKENLTGIVEHEAFGADTIKQVIDYIYKKDYETSITQTPVSGGSNTNLVLMEHVRVYAAADYYQMWPLKQLVVEKFEADAKADFQVNGFADVLVLVFQITAENSDNKILAALQTLALNHAEKLVNSEEFTSALFAAEELRSFATKFMKVSITQQAAVIRGQASVLFANASHIIELYDQHAAELQRHEDEIEGEREYREAVTDEPAKNLKALITTCPHKSRPNYSTWDDATSEYYHHEWEFNKTDKGAWGPARWEVKCPYSCFISGRTQEAL